MNNVSIIAVLTGPEISSWTLIPGLKVPLTKGGRRRNDSGREHDSGREAFRGLS